jgi:hypothetical protein
MNIGEQKDEHIFNAVYENISNVITNEIYNNGNTGIPISIPERIDDLIYDETESQIVSITYTSLWN